MVDFYIGQKCAVRSKSGKTFIGFVSDLKKKMIKKENHIKVTVGKEEMWFPLKKTLFLFEGGVV